MEEMTKQESIAYEMAMLAKENRELRHKNERWQAAVKRSEEEYNELRERYEKLRQENCNLKHPKKDKTNLGLLWCEKDVPAEAKVVISDTATDIPRYPKGFVMEVDHVAVREDGLVTLYGKTSFRDEARHDDNAIAQIIESKINNKSYSWARVDDNAQISTTVQVKGQKHGCYRGFGAYSKVVGKRIETHYEYENLMYLPGEE